MPPVIRALDFSEFHPLDHRLASGYCRSLPGGWRNHLDLAWDFRWKPQLAAATLCRLDHHRWLTGWHRDVPVSVCGNCYRSRPR